MPRTQTPQPVKDKLAARLRSARARRGLKQEEVAQEIGVKTDTYAGWEQGEAWPDPQNLRTAQEVLEVELLDLAAQSAGADESAFTQALQPLADELARLRLQVEEQAAYLRRLQDGN